MGQKKKWSSEAKFEIALRAIKGEMTLNAICQRYKVAPSLVHKWKKQLVEQGAHLFEKEDKKTNDAVSELKENQNKLYAKIGQLTMERNVLKKCFPEKLAQIAQVFLYIARFSLIFSPNLAKIEAFLAVRVNELNGYKQSL